MNAELIQKVEQWRNKIRDGSITLEEMREGVKYLRAQRFAAQEASRASAKRGVTSSSKDPRSGDDLLKDFL